MAITYEKIASTTLSTAIDNINFTSITGTYTDIVLIVNAKNSDGADTVYMEFNSDTGTNYSVIRLEGNGSTVSNSRQANASNIGVGVITTSSAWANIIVNILNYSNSTTNKVLSAKSYSPGYSVRFSVGTWRNTNPITSIKIYAGTNFSIGSAFTLYGIKAA